MPDGWTPVGTTKEGATVYVRHSRYLANEGVCIDCMQGDHRMCREEGGYVDDEDNSLRCACHLTDHALDNRACDLGGQEQTT